jgi:hypothetical protein
MATFCKRVVTLGHTIKGANNLPAYKDLSKSQVKSLLSQVHAVASSAPTDIKDAATAMSEQIDLMAADGSEDDVKLQSAGDAIDSYSNDHCTTSGGVKTVAATAATSTTTTNAGSCTTDLTGSCTSDTSGSSVTTNAGSCTTDLTGSCTSDTSGSSVTTNAGSCTTDLTGSCTSDTSGSSVTTNAGSCTTDLTGSCTSDTSG